MKLFKTLLVALVYLLIATCSFAQNCPPNINFENNNLLNWNCWKGIITTATSGNPSIPIWNPNSPTIPVIGRHQITSGAALDPYFLLAPAANCPIVCPWIPGNTHSLKLGNDHYNDSCERVVYYFHVPSNYYTFTYWYAIVLENPGSSHFYNEMPRFQVSAYDSATGVQVSCTNSNFVVGSTMPGFVKHKISSFDTAMCKNWAPAFLNFKNMAGKTVAIEFFTADCTLGGHFGYAYVDFDQCSTASIKLAGCANSGFDTLVAPPGFQYYQWFDTLFNPIANGSNDTLIVPALTDTVKYQLAFYPYPGYGCADTILIIVAPLKKPIADFTFVDSICPGISTSFTNLSYSTNQGQYVNNWHWDFGDVTSPNNYSMSSNPSHTYSNLGTYTVSLVVRTSSGCFSDTIRKTIHIVNNNKVSLGSDTTICFGDTITITAKSPFNQTWNWSSGTLSTTPNSATFLVYTNTKLIVSSTSACPASDTMMIYTNRVLITATSKDTIVCNNSPIQLTVSSLGGYNYFWYPMFNSVTQTNNDTIQMSVTHFDTITVLVTDTIGCSDTASVIINIKPNPTIDLLTDTSICIYNCDTLHYIGNAAPGTTYTWNFNSGTQSNASVTDPVVCWPNPGTKTVKLTISKDNCISTDSVTISIHDTPSPYIIGDLLFCKENQTVLSCIPTYPLYSWSEGSISNSITVTDTGRYSVTVIDKYGCLDSIATRVGFYPSPIANAGRDTILLEGSPTMINGVNSQGAVIYNWSNGMQSNSFSYIVDDSVEFILTVTNQYGCTDADSVNIFSLACRGAVLPNAFTPNGDGIDDVFAVLNPTDFDHLISLEIYNRWGQLVFATNNKYIGWNGQYKSVNQEMDTFIYVAITDCKNNIRITTGNIILLR